MNTETEAARIAARAALTAAILGKFSTFAGACAVTAAPDTVAAMKKAVDALMSGVVEAAS